MSNNNLHETASVLTLILGGGAGTRLYPLTKLRAKPAVPIAGKYRLVDIPISNSLNSGFEQIYLLTQFNSVSLHRHIAQTYKFDHFSKGWVQILAAEQTPRYSDWFQGTADAVRKHLGEIRATNPRDILILSGDHLYRMDYRPFVRAHHDSAADITLAVHPVGRAETSRFGIVETGAAQRIIRFHEKPSPLARLELGASSGDPTRPYLASMGIYLFRAETLYHLLETNPGSDFGQHLLPDSVRDYQVTAYPFEGYWEDIGTIRSFYEANLALTCSNAPFNLYDPERPIYTHPRFLPPSQIDKECVLNQTLLAEGCRIMRSQISESVIGIRSIVGPEARLTRTILMGADEYESDVQRAANVKRGLPHIGISAGCLIEGAIIDKNARIGAGTIIRYLPERVEMDMENYVVRDGIVVVLKNAVIPAGTVI